ncbi:MAG: UPF0182 family protein [Kineosporiaceae bacterium]
MSFDREPAPAGDRPVLRRRRRSPFVATLVALAVTVVAVALFARIWTDVAWFRQLGYGRVFGTQLLTRGLLFVAGAALMAAVVGGSLWVAYRSRPIYAPVSMEPASLDRYREGLEPVRRLVAVAVPVVLALFAGSAASQQWQTVLLWLNRVPFGSKDEQFGLDLGFFVFTLPWVQFLIGFLSSVVFVAGLASVATHYLYGGVRFASRGSRLTSAARAHLSVLAAAFLLLRAADYWFGRYALTTKEGAGNQITGLRFTDATAVLTARGILALGAAIVAVLFLAAVFVRSLRLVPVFGVVLLTVSAIIVGGIYPAAVQRFRVQPNQLDLEPKYIARNIAATRAAYGVDTVSKEPYEAKVDANVSDLRSSADAIPGIRLQDPAIVGPTFRQLEQNKQYYGFSDSLDVDRYTLDGKQGDTVIAARELNLGGVPTGNRNWVNDHLVYTHGFGVVAAYGNRSASDGKPVFFQSGIPSTGALGDYEPRIYFGEFAGNPPEYSIVGNVEGAAPIELDYPDDKLASGQRNTTYAGSGGVPIGSSFARLMYAIKFQEQNILLAKQVNEESRIIYDRRPLERVQKVAPWLTLDGDPYPAVVGKRVLWLVDGFTTTDRYPYSQLMDMDDATSDSLTQSSSAVTTLPRKKINYIRNSVKAVVDAFDGSVTLYAWDETDPLLKAWSKAFGNTVKPLSEMDGDLIAHVRYPEDLFKVQRKVLEKYHVTDPPAFFNSQDFWQVPDDPISGGGAVQQPPYYLTLQMPQADEARFSLTSTYIPVGRSRNVLTGFLQVDSDAGSSKGTKREGYGKLRLLQLPPGITVPGPGQVDNNIRSDSGVTQQLTYFSGGGQTKVTRGNLLTVPLAGGLIYVQPVYVESTGKSAYPLLRLVLVAFGDKVGMGSTLEEALTKVFGAGPGTGGSGSGGSGGGSGGGGSGGSGTGTTPPPAGGGTTGGSLAGALADAEKALTDSQAALRAGDWVAYGEAQKRLQSAIEAAVRAQGPASSTASGSASPTPSASASAGAASPSPSASPSDG